MDAWTISFGFGTQRVYWDSKGYKGFGLRVLLGFVCASEWVGGLVLFWGLGWA